MTHKHSRRTISHKKRAKGHPHELFHESSPQKVQPFVKLKELVINFQHATAPITLIVKIIQIDHKELSVKQKWSCFKGD